MVHSRSMVSIWRLFSVGLLAVLFNDVTANSHNVKELETEDSLVYTFFPVSSGAFHFKVKATNDARIALTSSPNEGDPMYEVFLGGWSNTKSAIRRNRRRPDVVSVATPQLMSSDEYTGFWVRWSDGHVTVEREGEETSFMKWRDPQPFKISYVGVSTGWGSKGNWLIDAAEMKG